MKTIHWVIIILVIIITGGIIFYSLSKPKNNSIKNDSESTNSTQTEDSNSNSNTEAINSNNNNNSTVSGNCQRNVNQKLMQDPINIKDQYVTLTVENFGDIKVQLYDKDAPKAVENFLRLTKSGYYDCLTFHRIAKDFVIQGGDPTGTGSGGDSAFGKDFEDELDPNTQSALEGYKHGVLAMANRGPNTNSSQFFIMLADKPLPHNYTIFGKVVSGLDVVDKIGQQPITAQMGATDGTPVNKIVISKALITQK